MENEQLPNESDIFNSSRRRFSPLAKEIAIKFAIKYSYYTYD